MVFRCHARSAFVRWIEPQSRWPEVADEQRCVNVGESGGPCAMCGATFSGAWRTAPGERTVALNENNSHSLRMHSRCAQGMRRDRSATRVAYDKRKFYREKRVFDIRRNTEKSRFECRIIYE